MGSLYLRFLSAFSIVVGSVALVATGSDAQSLDRLSFQGNEIFLNGGNVAWVDFARDVGPGPTDLGTFRRVFRTVRQHHGNSMRLWVHANGKHTPAWRDSTVIGPGPGTIADLRRILDVAQQQGVGLVLCLWSFDMLRKSYGEGVTDRAYHLLTDSTLTDAYVQNALVPMVRAVKDHPSLVAWEIFNEPEGMSTQYGWDFTRHVPMKAIQRFINRAAGAIHRTDPDALVTNSAWSFKSMRDRPPSPGILPQTAIEKQKSTSLSALQRALTARYRRSFTREEARAARERLESAAWHHYYTDERLIAAGGDPAGTLDFYSVHYYDWAPARLSPFHTNRDHWSDEKPIVVSEFAAKDYPDLPWPELSITLFQRGYAGALAWQWYGQDEHWDKALVNMERVGKMEKEAATVPPMYLRLAQNHPNPVREKTTIRYDLAENADVTLMVYDLMGRRVATLIDEFQSPGRYSVDFDAQSVGSGAYFYRLQAGERTETRRMTVVR